ncbi:MtrB/PioB family outer membrane beta-barrel protein [Dokdonella sp.]|uniref:MtrB/PioB family outer membrane beta-barrel protein n=1 Tax=Dokdonella sp. TaxID=2291710 RepID=UPI002F3E9BC6
MSTSRLFRRLPLAVAIAAVAANAHADSGVGVDTWRANELDPNAGATIGGCDDRGTSWLEAGVHRSPTGHLYACPPPSPAVTPHGNWQTSGVLSIGAVATGGDDDNALWNRYADWDSGIVLALLAFDAERPVDGSYASVRASRVSDDDEYYQAVFGRAGSYKVQAFLRTMPNLVTNTAKPIWNGVGTDRLTLPAGYVAGASSPAAISALSAATPARTLGVTREKQGLGFSVFLTPQWTAYANATDERRHGARPFGGPFFFNFPFPDDGGVLETVKPIDDSTINLDGGFRYAGNVWRMDFGYSGSFYRDRYTHYTYAMPFALSPLVAGAVSAPLTTGQFATEPDNDYHNLKAAFTRKLPLNGELSLTASGGRMTQDDTLIAPIACEGVFGIGLGGSLQTGPQNPFLYDCANWNTPAALSRRTADMRIDTSLLDARMVLQPGADLTVRGGVRHEREDYRSVYLAYNPLTGQYGYVSENGAQGSVVPGESGIWDASDPSAITRVRSLPLDMQTTEANVGADWRAGAHDTLGATLAFSRYEPTHRERRSVDDRSVKLTWTNRALDWLTLRANYTWLRQDGDRYDYDPYDFTYSIDLPGFIAPPNGVPAHTVDALRKYDVASRSENKLDLMATFMPREDMTITASLRGDDNDYDAVLGRRGYDTLGATVQWEWQPAPGSNASIYYAYDRSRLRLANINEILDSGSDPRLGGGTYPDIGRWWADDTQRNHTAGAMIGHAFGRVRVDASWNYLYARGMTAYRFASPLALAWADTVSGDGPGSGAFPPMTWRVHSLGIGVRVPLHERIALRVFDRYERGRISDWHYLGFGATRTFDHRVYTDGGPEGYDAHLVGILLDIRL